MLTGRFNGLPHGQTDMPVATAGDQATQERTITKETIREFASLVGDENPLHLDEDYAETGIFDGIVAHGMLGAGLISAALAGLPGDIVYVSQDLSFEAPVRPGQTLTAEVEVTQKLEDDRLRVRTEARTEQRVLWGEAVILSIEH
jgi:3-hydroxybutyryl-CoA dehydratase